MNGSFPTQESGLQEPITTLLQDGVLQISHQCMAQALAFHRAGCLGEAQRMYQAVLALRPEHPDANHNSGALLLQAGRAEEAVPYFEKALASDSINWQYWISTVDALIQAQKISAAAHLLEQARRVGLARAAIDELVERLVALPWQVPNVETRSQLKTEVSAPSATEIIAITALLNQDRLSEMQVSAQELTQRYPGNALGWKMLAIVWQRQGYAAQAFACQRKVVEVDPNQADIWDLLGLPLVDQGELIEAQVYFLRALRVNSTLVTAQSNLGLVLHRQGLLSQAAQCFKRCIELAPSFHVAHLNLSVVLDELGQPDAAEVAIRQALVIKPDFAQAYNTLGFLLKDQGSLVEAETCTRRAIELNPSDTAAYSNLMFLLNYDPDKSAEEIYQSYRAYDERHGLPYQSQWLPHVNTHDGQRRLRVGYVCATFSQHSTRFFLEPLLANHDHAHLELFAYSELLQVQDAVTERYRSYVDHWVSTVGLDDVAVAQRIRDDGIDVLVDISGQTRGNRLGMFARKPAPVSLHWLDFGYTTGLSAIDYYLTDVQTVPGDSEHLFAETPWRLPVPALVYRPPVDTGDVSPLPMLQNGYVTFGTLTRSIRINYRTLRAWAEILQRVPGSRLVIDSVNYKDTSAQHTLAQKFAALGVAAERLSIGYHSPPWDVIRSIDIALDCFPHNSGTTLFELLYMGVPFVTLAGRPSVGRLGSAILHGVGHAEWVAYSESEYVNKVVALAKDQQSLQALRSNLRRKLKASSLMDEAGFARHVETAYDAMFAHWLTTGKAAMAPEQVDNPATSLASLPAQTPSVIDVEAQLMHDMAQSMDIALAQHRAGKLEVAEEMYRAILEFAPNHADANHNLAVIAVETGHAAGALPYFEKALTAQPTNWQYWRSHFDALLQAGQWQTAVDRLETRRRQGLAVEELSELVLRAADAAYLAATSRVPVKGLKNKGGQRVKPVPAGEIHQIEALFSQDKLDEVVRRARTMVRVYPHEAFGWKALGAALINLGQVRESIVPLRTALERVPDDAGVLSNLGFALLSQHHPVEAEMCLRVALRMKPQFAAALINLGANLIVQDRFDEAGDYFRQGLALEPHYGPAYNHLGRVLDEQGRLVESVESYRTARDMLAALPQRGRSINIHLAQAHQSLCMNYAKLADHREVVSEADAAMAVLPDDAELWERRLYAFSYHPDLSVNQIFAEFVRWGDRFAPASTDFSRHDRTPGRRLRVGYVSPDFRRHTSRFYFWPFFANHDHTKVELFAYSNVKLDDDFTRKFKTVFEHWCDIRDLSDAEVAAQVQADGIDILVDGCNHMRDERLGVFALKPAPIQVTWLGAAWTTGLKAVDYVLFDPFIAPPETVAREHIVRLPHCFVPFESMTDTGEPQPPPCLKNGYITFAYSGRTERLNHHTFRVWGEILRRMPSAQLVLDFRYFADPLNQAHFRALMQQHGVDTHRVVMRCSPNIFKGLHDFDILLDCFPHSGGTMLIDALWMGVPALTLAGRPPLGRIGTTFVSNLGLSGWVAHSEQDYIDKACALAGDVPGLTRLRAGMRQQMLHSPLMDGKGFAASVEWAYAEMWRRFCQGEAPSALNVPSHFTDVASPSVDAAVLAAPAVQA